MKRRKYTLAALLGIIMAIASSNSSNAKYSHKNSRANNKYSETRCTYTVYNTARKPRRAVTVYSRGNYCYE